MPVSVEAQIAALPAVAARGAGAGEQLVPGVARHREEAAGGADGLGEEVDGAVVGAGGGEPLGAADLQVA